MAKGDSHHLDSVEKLRAIVGEPGAGIELKVYDHLEEEAIAHIAATPFIVLATSDAEGNLDASPKGDDPGFVVVEDERTLLIPDRPGNRLAYGLTNIVANPRVGVIFIIPGTTETLRVNGTVELRSDPELLTRLEARGKPAILVDPGHDRAVLLPLLEGVPPVQALEARDLARASADLVRPHVRPPDRRCRRQPRRRDRPLRRRGLPHQPLPPARSPWPGTRWDPRTTLLGTQLPSWVLLRRSCHWGRAKAKGVGGGGPQRSHHELPHGG